VSDDADVVREFCRGYVNVAQKDGDWTSNQNAFALTLPIMVLSGYVDPESLRSLEPEAVEKRDEFRQQCLQKLSDCVLDLFAFFKDQRAEQKQVELKLEKVGRNEQCPCGSGKKYKKCCGVS
jgi:uncharacterized protein YecA (UPF0149 family)